MANIKKIAGKKGVTYKITVTAGTDIDGKQVRHYKTWKPDAKMTERQAEKAVQAAALDFERSIQQGYVVDNRQTFAAYCEYVIDLKERSGCKFRTIERYRELTKRIYPAFGHMKLAEIRPQHLNNFYKQLSETLCAGYAAKAAPITDIRKRMKDAGLSQERAAKAAGVSKGSISAVVRGDIVAEETAIAIAAALKEKPENLFMRIENRATLSKKTVVEYHRLIRTVLAQAEKEMIVPYNAAAKSTPPRLDKHESSCLQPDQIPLLLEALESEPLKWRTIVHLLLVTGCRRGEIMGLKWEKIDFKAKMVKIDSELLYSPVKGVYESTTKTRTERTLKLPDETVQLLREYQKAQHEMQFANGDRWHNTGYVFTRDNGIPMHPEGITAWLRSFSDRHGMPHIHPHELRHTVASVLIAGGVDIVTVSKHLGHANAATTENIYAHLIEQNKAMASECIADAMLRQGNRKHA